MQGAVDETREFGERFLRRPRARTGFVVIHHRTHRAVGGFPRDTRRTRAIGHYGDERFVPGLDREGIV